MGLSPSFTLPPQYEWAPVIEETVPQSYLSVYGSLSILSKSFDPPTSATEHRTDLPDLYLGGYASPQVLDQQNHLITKEALSRDLPRFMAVPEFRNSNLLHTNIQVASVKPNWTNPQTGETFRTKVDEVGLYVVVKIRTDRFRPPVLDEVIRDVLNGKLAAFSISADAPFEHRRYVCKDGTCFYIIDVIYLYEITLCARPVNQDALAAILTKSLPLTLADEYAPYALCQDGSCLLPTASTINLAQDNLNDQLRQKYLSIIAKDGSMTAGLPNATPESEIIQAPRKPILVSARLSRKTLAAAGGSLRQ